MPLQRMHPDEVQSDATVVRRLLQRQFPKWAHLPIEPVESGGTDNALYRLGNTLVARLPRVPGAAAQIEMEERWLPALAPHLPLVIPEPVAAGQPDAGYPFIWAVYRWLDGTDGTAAGLADPDQAARALARFIRALWTIDPTGGFKSGRGGPLIQRDAFARVGIATLPDSFNKAALTRAWDRALAAPPWDRPPVWIHGDLHPANMLVVHGDIHAILDFSCLGLGDPATDVMAAWNVLPARTWPVFREVLAVDDATWDRARGWSLSMWAGGFDYYLHTNPVFIRMARFALGQILEEVAHA